MTDIHYLDEVLCELSKKWPENRTINIVCHGHSVPAGYFATPFVDTLHAYPHLLLRLIKERFPFACVNAIVTAIGGEDSVSGEKRFEKEVLSHDPRPSYQRDPNRVYGLQFAGFDIRFTVENNTLLVKEVIAV